MAPEAKKKSNSHSDGGGGMKDAGERILALIAILFFISVVIYRLSGGGGVEAIWGNIKDGFDAFLHQNAFGRFLGTLFFGLKFLGTYISLLFFVGIVVVVRKLTVVNKEEAKRHKPLQGETMPYERRVSEKWQRVEEHLSSDNPSDWRLAILEADILLEEMLEKKGYIGDTLGEKLKNADKGNFASLDKAWEAHKIRNQIAHEGASFVVGEREAKRVVGLFREVLDEAS